MSLVRRALLTSAIVCGALFAASPMAIAQDKNCGDFTYQEDAQEVFDAVPGDPHNLDANNDGVACEDRPHRPVAQPSPTPSTTPANPTPSTSKPKPTTTKKPSGSQVKVKPVGGVATGDGSSSDDSGAYIALGGVVLVGAAAGTVLVARRRAGH
jgi:hypothetical protein